MSLAYYAEGLTGPTTDVWLAVLARQKAFAEHAMAHLDDDAFFRRPAIIDGTNLNSVAIIVQHLAGNMRSRWTDFLTTDGEKPWRHRDTEFDEPPHTAASRAQLMTHWQEGWTLVFNAIQSLKPADLQRRVTIRHQEHTVEAAVIRQLDHYAYHVGQIVTLARLFTPDRDWKYFTIPPAAPPSSTSP